MSGDEDLVDLLSRVANAVVAGRAKEAAKLMDSIRFEPPQAEARADLRTSEKARVFKRDKFICRYCSVPTTPPVILRVPPPLLRRVGVTGPSPQGHRAAPHPVPSTT